MKITTTIAKNLKLLFRSKESAYTIVFGPILIILIVSFAFTGSSDQYTIRVGTYAPAPTLYSARVIDILNQKNYVVSVYPDQNACIESVKASTNHACIVFSSHEQGNGTVPVTFYLDLSRTNIVYRISDDLSGALDLQSDAIRNQLAGDALTRMNSASQLIARDLNTTQELERRFAAISTDLSQAKIALAGLSNATINASDEQTLKGYQLGLAQNTRNVVNISDAAIDKASQMLSQLDTACTDCTEATQTAVHQFQRDLDDVKTKITLIAQDTTEQQLFEANLLLDETISDLTTLQSQLANDSAARASINAGIMDASQDADKNARDIKQVVTSLNYTKAFLDGQSASAQDISAPVSTSIVNVATTEDSLTFTYPYLLVLVIMFIGMLLASTLIVADKTSSARFRNFTTPTTDTYHIIASFITAFLLLAIEVGIILLLSTIFIAQPLLLNTASTISLVCVAIVLFTFIGMIIGYLSSTQEAAMIASISIGSILLFVSNLIIPIEGMTALVQAITSVNPYLILSDLLKKSMLYGVTLKQVSQQLLLLLVIAIVLLVITIIIERRIKKRYFRQDAGLLAQHVAAPLQVATSSGAMMVHNEVELLDALDHMTRGEFEAVVRSDDNPIAEWAAKELRNRKLAKQLRTTNKEKMILRLDNYLQKHGKSMRRP